jgi:hypothetical protein
VKTARALLPLTLLLATGVPPGGAAEEAWRGPIVAGQLAAPPRNETSGLAASLRTPGLLWLHDDSGGDAALFAVGPDGRTRGRLEIAGVRNVDWEDLASAELDGRPWLVIGDVGDNLARRASVALHFVEEPTKPATPRATPAATLRVRYADGPRDCEGVAVDPRERAVYLLSKRDLPPRLYRVELPSPLRSGDVVARQVGLVPGLPQPTEAQRRLKGHLGRHRAEPCALDFAADGSAALVVTYGDVLLFPRRSGATWAEALQGTPVRLAEHGLPQAEAGCFARDGRTIHVASEEDRRLLRYERR